MDSIGSKCMVRSGYEVVNILVSYIRIDFRFVKRFWVEKYASFYPFQNNV